MSTDVILELSREDVDQYYKQILLDMTVKMFVPSVVIGLSRGGLDMGVRLSHSLECDFVPLVWQTRDGDFRDKDLLISTISKYSSKDILIVDDICDSGRTISEIKEILPKNENILTAALVYNTASSTRVSFSGMHINKSTINYWVVFPWEKPLT